MAAAEQQATRLRLDRPVELGVDALELVARVSNGGGPIAASGDLFGAVTWSAGDGNQAVAIVIDQIVE